MAFNFISIQEKSTVEYHFMFTWLEIINNENIKCNQGCRTSRHLYTAGRSVRLYCHSGNNLAVSRAEDVSILCMAKRLHSYIYTLEKVFYI